MLLRSLPALAVLLGTLTACIAPEQHGPESPRYRYPDGSRLLLARPFEIPADAATVRFQFGRLVAPDAVQTLEPHCVLEVDTVRARPQRIEPDAFVVTQVQRNNSQLGAALDFLIRSAYADDETPSLVFYQTAFSLRSERQPGVRRLTCQHQQYAAGTGVPRHLTLVEIRQALGNWFTLEIPG